MTMTMVTRVVYIKGGARCVGFVVIIITNTYTYIYELGICWAEAKECAQPSYRTFNILTPLANGKTHTRRVLKNAK